MIKNPNPNLPKPPRWIQLFLTILFGVAGLALLFCSLYIPPMGQIHPSVITSFGMILIFVGLVIGIDYNSQLKIFEAFQYLSHAAHQPSGNRTSHGFEFEDKEHRQPSQNPDPS